MGISFGNAVILAGAGIGGIVGAGAGSKSGKSLMYGGVGAAAGALGGYALTLIPGVLGQIPGAVNTGLNDTIANTANSAIDAQIASPTSPTAQTMVANPASLANSNSEADYLDVPTIFIQGAGEEILAGSYNTNNSITVGITNPQGWPVYTTSGTGSVLINMDKLNLPTGTYKVTMIDTTSGGARSAALNYLPANSDSISNFFTQVGQGAANWFSFSTSPLASLF